MFAYSCRELLCDFHVSNPSGINTTYRWDLGDGATAEGTTVRHRYTSRAPSLVTLTVSGRDSSFTESATVEPAPGAPSTWIFPGESIQEAVNNHPDGTEFVIKPGVHRLQGVVPKNGNRFVGESNPILSGAKVLVTFERANGVWVAVDQAQEGRVHGECLEAFPRCDRPEDLFLDGEPLVHVANVDALGPGKWYFDYEADRIYIFDDPTSRLVEISETPFAFRGDASNVVIRDLIIEKYANPAQTGAIHAQGSSPSSPLANNWIIETNEIRFNHGAGIGGLGNATQVIGNYVHHNGQIGIGGNGDAVLVEANEISFNNTMGFLWEWEAGGTKFAWTTNLVVRNNFVHDNQGPGLWTDIENFNTLYEANIVVDNLAAGIYHEISYDAVIRQNTIRGNGFGWAEWLWGAGILVAASQNVEIYENTVEGNYNGITAVQQDRGEGTRGAFVVRGLYVHDNTVDVKNGATVGLVDGRVAGTDSTIFTDAGNLFDRNRYYLGDLTRPFHWLAGWSTKEEWQEQGQDIDGEFQD